MSIGLSRREAIIFGAGGLASLRGSSLLADKRDADLDVIDCHTHFYDPTRPGGIPWPSKGSALYRTVLPKHLRELKHFRRVTGTVIVEASDRLEDNAWLLGLAKDDPFVVGVVGRLEPGGADFSRHLKRFAADRLFRGMRISTSLLRKLLDKNNVRDLKLFADRDLALDVNGGPETPAELARLAKRLPDLRIVLNHIGNVKITSQAPPREWVDGVRSAARHDNVSCKISALCWAAAGGGRKAPLDLDFYRPYIDVVWNAFGDDRVIYGSDWPASEAAADYATQQRIVMEYASGKGDDVTRKFCSLNAKRVYKWVERDGRRG
ncbi:MAG: amidohydrolase family protein [Pirellulaceae bacterium]|jgi:predicted TIM-barrel fold metal-dependent hydrolase|nr:amidohydrolase family protein [Pirellulaceae bacterium]MDP7017851.1 amidohydrolase family protein [Pirellulaceae bacterium]